jgi:threonine dehydrogenase-like Zn-dependent dehydrogenase
MYNGFLSQPKVLVMGHEFLGVVEEVGSAIANLHRGRRVVVPFPIACGRCFFCSHGLPVHCEIRIRNIMVPRVDCLMKKVEPSLDIPTYMAGIWGQAEHVRVPLADVGPRRPSALQGYAAYSTRTTNKESKTQMQRQCASSPARSRYPAR